MTLANYSTEVPVSRTFGEVTGLLVAAGASALMTEYADGHPTGIAFRLQVPGPDGDLCPVSYRLPCDWRGTLQVLQGAKIERRLKTEDQARRVAWRVVKDWLRAQLALIEIGAARPEQVLLPYAVTNDGRTFYERIHQDAGGFAKLLGSGGRS